MKSVLFVSIAFPPKLDPECIQTAKYYKYLRLSLPTTQFSIVTSKSPTRFMPEDNQMKDFLKGNDNIIKINLLEPSFLHKFINKVVPPVLQLPDSKYSFYLQWKKVVKQLPQKPSVIYSRSYPLSSAIMALKLQKYYQVPWVMHLSDPWVDSPLHSYSRISAKKNMAWEKECFQAASIISLTSEKTVALYKLKYPQWNNKFIYSPNVYDPSDISKEEKKVINTDKLRFVYTGGLANTRTAEPILKGIKTLRKLHPEILDKCQFIWAGELDSKNKSFFQRYKDPTISHLGTLCYMEAQQLQRTAHILITIDSDIISKGAALFFPSKLLDYWVAGHRILGVTNKNSTTDNFINMHHLGSSIYFKNSTKMFVEEVKKCVENFEKKNSTYFNLSLPSQKYSAQYNANKLSEILRKVSNES